MGLAGKVPARTSWDDAIASAALGLAQCSEGSFHELAFGLPLHRPFVLSIARGILMLYLAADLHVDDAR